MQVLAFSILFSFESCLVARAACVRSCSLILIRLQTFQFVTNLLVCNESQHRQRNVRSNAHAHARIECEHSRSERATIRSRLLARAASFAVVALAGMRARRIAAAASAASAAVRLLLRTTASASASAAAAARRHALSRAFHLVAAIVFVASSVSSRSRSWAAWR